MDGGDHYREQRMGCVRHHPYEGSVGVCASCVSDRLSKESSSSSERGRFAKNSTLSEEYFLWKEGASSSSSISKHGVTKGGRIVDTIASLIKTDYAIPTNYERPRSRPERPREEHSSRSYYASAAEQSKAFESSLKGVLSTNEDIIDTDFRTFSRITLAQSERDSKSRDICEITPEEEPEREPEPGQTIHALLDAEPKSGKFSRSTSKGSPASYFSRSGSRRQSWTVFWRSDKKDDCARATTTTTAGGGGGEVVRSVSDAHDRAACSRLAFNGVDTSDFRNRRHSESSLKSNHYLRRSSTRTTTGEGERADVSLSTRLSAEEGCKRLADSDYLDRKPRVVAAAAAASTHSFERNRSWEQLGLAKLPFASVYAAPTSGTNGVNGVGEQRRNRWKMVKKKSEKLEAKTTTTTGAGVAAGDHHAYPLTVIHQAQAHVANSFDEDGVGGESSGKPTPCTSNCFPQSGGRHIVRREDAHISHEKLRHRRLSIYSYGIMSQPQLTGLDSQFSYTGRSRVARPYTYNGKRRESRESRESYYYPNGRIAVDYWDGDESMSPCDHYVEVSHRGGDGVSTGIIDFIPVSEAQKKAYDWVERTKIEGTRSPPRWIERRGESMEDGHDLDLDDDSSISESGDINFLGKEELTTVFEQDSESGYGEEYAVGAFDGQADDYHPHVYKDDEELDLTESPDSRSFSGVGKSRLAKGKSIISEIEELEEEDVDVDVDDLRREQQQQFDRNGGEAVLSIRSLSDAGSYARESTDSEILPTRNSLRSLFYMDGRGAIDDTQGDGEGEREEGEEGRAYKPDNPYEEQDLGDWTPEPTDSDHRDGQTNNNSASIKRSPWKNITMSPSMRKKFLWPRSSPQPHLRRSFEVMGNSNGRMFNSGNGHHQTSFSFSDTDSQLARPRSPTFTNENTSSNLLLLEGPEVPLPGGVLADTFQDEITNGTSETVLSIVEIEESSPKSSPLRSSSSRASSPQRGSLSRSSSKSPQITLSRCSSRRSRSSSWNSCLTDTGWSAQSGPTKKGENGSHPERQGPLSTLIRLGKKLSRRSSPINISFNTSPWRSFSKASPQRGEATSA